MTRGCETAYRAERATRKSSGRMVRDPNTENPGWSRILNGRFARDSGSDPSFGK
jgi:hypothetical protein